MSASSSQQRRFRQSKPHAARPAKPPSEQPRLILLNKPHDVLPQFSDEQGRATLKNFVNVPDVYPAGRLDRDSEGLMLLTNDGRLQARIADPRFKMAKTYWAQVEGEPTKTQLQQLRNGVMLKDGVATASTAQIIPVPKIWPRTPPVRFRKNIPTAWIALVIHEGRNRQVRRMTAAVGLPTLRLVRVQVGPWALAELLPGQWRDVAPVFPSAG